jgi:hypothetical protein
MILRLEISNFSLIKYIRTSAVLYQTYFRSTFDLHIIVDQYTHIYVCIYGPTNIRSLCECVCKRDRG